MADTIEVRKLESWLLAHERIVIVALVLIAGVFLGNRWLNYDAAQKDAKVVALTAVVEQDKQNVAALALAASQAQNQYQLTLDAITKQNTALEGSIAQMSASLAQRQAKDKQLPLPELGKRLEVLVPAAQGGVTPTSTGIALDSTASYSVVIALEQVPILTDQLVKETQVAENNAHLVNQSQIVNEDLTKQIGALGTQISDADKQCRAEVSAEKAKTKKAFVRGFKWGFIGGFFGGIFTGHAVGL